MSEAIDCNLESLRILELQESEQSSTEMLTNYRKRLAKDYSKIGNHEHAIEHYRWICEALWDKTENRGTMAKERQLMERMCRYSSSHATELARHLQGAKTDVDVRSELALCSRILERADSVLTEPNQAVIGLRFDLGCAQKNNGDTVAAQQKFQHNIDLLKQKKGELGWNQYVKKALKDAEHKLATLTLVSGTRTTRDEPSTHTKDVLENKPSIGQGSHSRLREEHRSGSTSLLDVDQVPSRPRSVPPTETSGNQVPKKVSTLNMEARDGTHETQESGSQHKSNKSDSLQPTTSDQNRCGDQRRSFAEAPEKR